MLFLDLPEDVYVILFALCDLEDLLRLELVCKLLRNLVSTRRVWLPMILSSDMENIPRVASHVDIKALSPSDLKALVVTARRSHRSWRRSRSVSPTRTHDLRLPRIKHSWPLPPRERLKYLRVDLSLLNSPLQLIPVPMSIGCRHEYVVLRRQPGLVQCLEIASGTCIWETDDSDTPIVACDVDADLVEGAKIFRLLTISAKHESASHTTCVLKIWNFGRGFSGELDVDSNVVVRKFRATLDISDATASLEGDFAVISDFKYIWLIDWKTGRCIRTTTPNLQWNELRIVGQHFMLTAESVVATNHFALRVMPLSEIFGNVKTKVHGGEIMPVKIIAFEELPSFNSDISVPNDYIVQAVTAGYCNNPWLQSKHHNNTPSGTFYVLSELWDSTSEMQYLALHQANAEYEPEPAVILSNTDASTASAETPRRSHRVLRMTQVGDIIESKEDSTFSYRCISQTGRIFVRGEEMHALSIQSFASDSKSGIGIPYIFLDGPNIEGRVVEMDPHSGALFCWAPRRSTFQMIYFGD